ncbi:MAG: hypothetical protein QOF15_4235 [Mycobacterium sp.]|nr:hypothetical protein [Mycobacterium sp.]
MHRSRSRLSLDPGLTDGASLAAAILLGIGRRLRCARRTSGGRTEVRVALLELNGRRFGSGVGCLPFSVGGQRDSEVGAGRRIEFAVLRVGEIPVSPTCPPRLLRRWGHWFGRGRRGLLVALMAAQPHPAPRGFGGLLDRWRDSGGRRRRRAVGRGRGRRWLARRASTYRRYGSWWIGQNRLQLSRSRLRDFDWHPRLTDRHGRSAWRRWPLGRGLREFGRRWRRCGWRRWRCRWFGRRRLGFSRRPRCFGRGRRRLGRLGAWRRLGRWGSADRHGRS